MPSYEFELRPKELLRLLFFKKICPDCKNKLIKNNEKTFLKPGWYSMIGTYSYGNQYDMKIRYYCGNCSKEIQLVELRHRSLFKDK